MSFAHKNAAKRWWDCFICDTRVWGRQPLLWNIPQIILNPPADMKGGVDVDFIDNLTAFTTGEWLQSCSIRLSAVGPPVPPDPSFIWEVGADLPACRFFTDWLRLEQRHARFLNLLQLLALSPQRKHSWRHAGSCDTQPSRAEWNYPVWTDPSEYFRPNYKMHSLIITVRLPGFICRM